MNINTTLNNYTAFASSQTQAGNTVGSEGRVAPTPADSTTTPVDQISLSPEAIEKSKAEQTPQTSTTPQAESPTETDESSPDANLTQEELQQLSKLKTRDTEVRSHEQAHLAAAGKYARSAASFTTQKGPDGNSYAVGGEVNIDVAEESTPEETIQKMQTVRRAALAPAQPSATDRQVAAQASVKEAEARQKLIEEQQDTLLSSVEGANPASDTTNNKSSQANDPDYNSNSFASLKKGMDQYIRNSPRSYSTPTAGLSIFG